MKKEEENTSYLVRREFCRVEEWDIHLLVERERNHLAFAPDLQLGIPDDVLSRRRAYLRCGWMRDPSKTMISHLKD